MKSQTERTELTDKLELAECIMQALTLVDPKVVNDAVDEMAPPRYSMITEITIRGANREKLINTLVTMLTN